ncbi:hypothetical protein MYXO_00170 [Myxococcaceae bacterium]|jgi:hypothetical protein|nr:hypothetical protein MYXO_00170 [Myxococcaceae bacterium]
MLTHLDEYPIHQTPEPIAHPSTGDRNFYDRYFFNGYDADGEIFFAVALGLYPNRRVMDASLSVIRDGVQRSIHASRLAPAERSETRVGPISVEVVEPMRTLRVRIADNDGGLTGDLVFRARAGAIEEPRFRRVAHGRVVMDSTRFTQFGRFEGSLGIDGVRIALDPRRHLGCRDRSWGIRPVGERDAGAPGPSPQFFWLWAPLHFDDLCTHFDVNEDEAGSRWHAFGAVLPALAADAPADAALPELPRPSERVAHRIDWAPGTRRARSARIVLSPVAGPDDEIELEPILTFQMLGLGYLHPTWGHGMWKGERAFEAEQWKLSECAPLDPRYLHVQQLCRARLGSRRGVGVLEQLVIGPHAPSGLQGLFDGAA